MAGSDSPSRASRSAFSTSLTGGSGSVEEPAAHPVPGPGAYRPRSHRSPARSCRCDPSGAAPVSHAPRGTDHLVVDGLSAVHYRAVGRLLKQVVERLALTLVERAEHLVLDR